MLPASVTLFALGVLSLICGMNSVAGISFDLGRMLLFIFLALAIATFVYGLTGHRRIGTSI